MHLKIKALLKMYIKSCFIFLRFLFVCNYIFCKRLNLSLFYLFFFGEFSEKQEYCGKIFDAVHIKTA